jgi:hypothetical protein
MPREAAKKEGEQMSNGDMPNPEELKEIMRVMSDTIPDLLASITKVMYGAQEGEEYGKAVANFYKALKDAGMSNEEAFALTKEYMGNFNIGNVIGGATKRAKGE